MAFCLTKFPCTGPELKTREILKSVIEGPVKPSFWQKSYCGLENPEKNSWKTHKNLNFHLWNLRKFFLNKKPIKNGFETSLKVLNMVPCLTKIPSIPPWKLAKSWIFVIESPVNPSFWQKSYYGLENPEQKLCKTHQNLNSIFETLRNSQGHKLSKST